jgi:hypothetical protein
MLLEDCESRRYSCRADSHCLSLSSVNQSQTSMTKLLLLNDRSVYDLIASIEVIFSENQKNTAQARLVAACDRLQIKSYSKEPQVLLKQCCKEEFTIRGASSDNEDKLSKFCSYLSERKKAAIVSVAGGDVQFYLLPRDSGPKYGACITSYAFTPSSQSAKTTDLSHTTNSSSTNATNPSSSSSSLNLKTGDTPSLPSAAATSSSTITSNSFLGKLLNKAKATQEVRNIPLNPIDEAKRQRVVAVETLMKRLREQFKSFVEDESFLEYHLEPMEKELRYVV